MTIGLSTYAFFWQHSGRVKDPLSVEEMVDRSAAYGADVFQICDFRPIESFDADRLRALRERAAAASVRLELGTRGVRSEHLDRYLGLARALDVRLVRSMLYDDGPDLSIAEMERQLRTALPHYESAGVTLALETYERCPTDVLAGLVERIEHPNLGVCLDPANCVAALENPLDVINRCAELVVNLHVKDFRFTRRDGLNGFLLTGAPLGEGQLDLAALFERVRPRERGISQVIEHWLPWQHDERTTVELEQAWTDHNITYLRSAT